MNVKKFLKKTAQKDLQSVQNDSDREILQRLKNFVVEEVPTKKRNKNWLWALASGAVAFAVAAILIIELVLPFGNHSGRVKYDEINMEQENSVISELTEALTDLTLHFTENQQVSVVRFFDLPSGDDLYYVLFIEENSAEAFYKMQLMIVVNNDYHYKNFTFEGEGITEAYSDYSIIYDQQIRADSSTGLNLVKASAKVDNSKHEIYVLLYEEYAFGNGNFLTVINNILDFNV